MPTSGFEDDNLLTESLGALQCLLMILAMGLMNYEPFKFNSASGLSVNMSIINFTGATFLLAQAYYGAFNNVDYWGDIKWYGLVSATVQFLGWGLAVGIGKYMKSRNNEIGAYGIRTSFAGVVLMILYVHIDSSLERIMKMCGFVTAVLYFFSLVPQIELITKNKSTRGWSYTAVFTLIGANFVGIIAAVAHYLIKTKQTRTLAKDFNWGKLIFCAFSILINLVFLYQWKLYRENEVH